MEERADASMFDRLKNWLNQLRHGRPGRRFIDHYCLNHRHLEQEPLWKLWLWTGLGFTLLVAGLFLSLPPGLPGFLLWAPGLALLASQFKGMAMALDWLERRLRNLSGRK